MFMVEFELRGSFTPGFFLVACTDFALSSNTLPPKSFVTQMTPIYILHHHFTPSSVLTSHLFTSYIQSRDSSSDYGRHLFKASTP